MGDAPAAKSLYSVCWRDKAWALGSEKPVTVITAQPRELVLRLHLLLPDRIPTKARCWSVSPPASKQQERLGIQTQHKRAGAQTCSQSSWPGTNGVWQGESEPCNTATKEPEAAFLLSRGWEQNSTGLRWCQAAMTATRQVRQLDFRLYAEAQGTLSKTGDAKGEWSGLLESWEALEE